MTRSVYQTLLGLNVYELSSDYIEEVRRLNPQREKFRDNIPTYCVTHNEIVICEQYFQFTSKSEDNWILFDLEYIHPILRHEISETSKEQFFDEIGLFEFMKNVPCLSETQYKKSLPIPTYIVIEVTYTNSYDYYSGGYDCEVEFNNIKLLEI